MLQHKFRGVGSTFIPKDLYAKGGRWKCLWCLKEHSRTDIYMSWLDVYDDLQRHCKNECRYPYRVETVTKNGEQRYVYTPQM